MEGEEGKPSLLNLKSLLNKPLTTARFAIQRFDANLLKFQAILEEASREKGACWKLDELNEEDTKKVKLVEELQNRLFVYKEIVENHNTILESFANVCEEEVRSCFKTYSLSIRDGSLDAVLAAQKQSLHQRLESLRFKPSRATDQRK